MRYRRFLGTVGAARAAARRLIAGAAGEQNPTIRRLTEPDIIDMMLGSSIQASRGVDTARAVQQMRKALARGKPLTMIDVDDLPQDWMTVTVGRVAGGGAWNYVTERTKEQNLPTTTNTSVRAVEALSKHLGKTFRAVIRLESAQSAGALILASNLGIPVVDACLSGRARPEIQQQIPWINGIPATPAALVTRWGDTVILDSTVDDHRVEDISRAVAVASGGSVQIAMNPMSAASVKRGVIKGALSQAITLGRTAREAVARDRQRTIEQLIEWYQSGWQWWYVSCEYLDVSDGVGGVDDEDYASSYCAEECALNVAAELEDKGYTVKGKPDRRAGYLENRRAVLRDRLLLGTWR